MRLSAQGPAVAGDRSPGGILRYDWLEQEHAALRGRLLQLEQNVARDLKSMKDETRHQMEAAERRLTALVSEEVEKRVREGAKSAAKQIMAEKVATKASAPVNEEPEQEEQLSCDFVETPAAHHQAKPKFSWSPQGDSEVSSAELADSKHRLEAIGTIARRVSASLGGSADASREESMRLMRHPEVSAVLDARRPTVPTGGAPHSAIAAERNVALTNCFQSGGGRRRSRDHGGDPLDLEMERLADLRRFASSVLGVPSSHSGNSSSDEEQSPAVRSNMWGARGQQGDQGASHQMAKAKSSASPQFGRQTEADHKQQQQESARASRPRDCDGRASAPELHAGSTKSRSQGVTAWPGSDANSRTSADTTPRRSSRTSGSRKGVGATGGALSSRSASRPRESADVRIAGSNSARGSSARHNHVSAAASAAVACVAQQPRSGPVARKDWTHWSDDADSDGRLVF